MEASNISLYAVNYAGRVGTKLAPLETVDEIADSLLPPTLSILSEGTATRTFPPRIHFFGHSLGALVAFELVRKIIAKGYIVHNLFISACRNPSALSKANLEGGCSVTFHHRKDDTALTKYLTNIGGIPVGIDDDLLRLYLPIMRSDYKAFESYAFRGSLQANEPEAGTDISDADRISCSLATFGGTSDSSVPEEDLIAWRGFSNGFHSHHRFPGKHFYFSDISAKYDVLSTIVLLIRR
jgi:surfactin synthase thioesterase subunit